MRHPRLLPLRSTLSRLKPSFAAMPALAFVTLTGCATFEQSHADQQANKAYHSLTDQSFELTAERNPVSLRDLLPAEQAWQLVETAHRNNPGLQQTWLTLQSSRLQHGVTVANQLPTLSAGLDATRVQQGTTYSPALTINWTVDLWQQLSDSSAAQLATVAANSWRFQAAKELLTANILQSWLALSQFKQLVSIEQRRVDTLARNEAIIVERYRKGLTDLKDLDTARTSTKSSQATLVDYENQLAKTIRDLTLLTGERHPDIHVANAFSPVSLPEVFSQQQNLAQRPDLKAAWLTISASQYQHKVAYKALLPSLSVSGTLSGDNTNLHDALLGSHGWRLLGQLTAPIFNAGSLSKQAEIARLNAEQQYRAFQQTLLTAVNEVDNAIALEKTLDSRILFTQQAIDSAKRSEVTYNTRYQNGTVSLLDLLQVQQQTFALENQLVQLTYQQLSNRLSLGLALGAGV